MLQQSGSKTTRVNTSSKRRDSSLKQPHSGTIGTLDDDYFQNNLKSPKSSILQNQLSARKIGIAPSTTKHSNEYYLKSKEDGSPSNIRKKVVKNPSMNINTEFQITNESLHEKSKAITTRELKVKPTPKTNFAMDVNPNLDLASIDQALKSAGPNSAASPKSKLYRDLSMQKQNSKAAEYYTSTSPQTKQVQPQFDTPELKTSSPEGDGSGISTSYRRPSTRQDPNWGALKLPVDSQFVLNNFASYLSPYEKEEIQKYTQVYYISDIYHKILARGEQEYDDERGDYLVVKNDHIRFRYEALEMLGRGSFGQVLKVYDHKRKEYAAIKVIRSPKKFHFQAKIEIRVLKYMMENYGADYNIVGLRDYFLFRNHVCLVFDLMDANLYDLLKKNKFKGFPLSTVRKFAIQVLYALKFLNHHKIVHCDLKPENILLKNPNKTGIKLIDFGSSCFENEKLYTYIQSRFYRSPEVILGLPYSTQIDMWSFGCLLCELYLGYPVFAGDSERDQLFNMFEVLGVPSRDYLDTSPRKTKFFDDQLQPITVANTKGKVRVPNGTPLTSFIKPGDETFLDLVRHCLEFDPSKRFTPDQALSHEWIIEGLPPQLQAQHLKFIRDTNQAEGSSNYNLQSKAASTHDIRAHQPDEEQNSQTNQQSYSRAHNVIENKSAVSLQIRKIQTQDSKIIDKHMENEDDMSLNAAQKKNFPRKLNLNDVQKEKFTLKAVYKAGSTRNLSQLNSERDPVTPSTRKATIDSLHKSQKTVTDLSRNQSKKVENTEGFSNKGLIAWESVSHRAGGDDKGVKPLLDTSPVKRSISNMYSPKVSHSVERNSIANKNVEREPIFNLTKTSSMLPALKQSTSQKNK